MTLGDEETRPVWFVGASWGGTDDQTDRFIGSGIWENGYRDGEFYDLVEAVQPGDHIAVKARLRRRRNLPFDNRDEYVPGMFIKAIGVVTRNAGDGRLLGVDWTRVAPPKEWYFSMYAQTIHAVYPDDWKTYALIAFAFDNKPQDIERWRNDPQYRDRFGDRVSSIQPNPHGIEPVSSPEPPVWPSYTINDILAEGCFLDQPTLEKMLDRLRNKKNIILQAGLSAFQAA